MENIFAVILGLLAKFLFYFFSGLAYVSANSTFCCLVCACVYGCYKCFNYVFAVKVSVHPAAVATFQKMALAFQAESMFSEECQHVDVGPKTDADLIPDPECVDTRRVRSNRRISYAVRVAHLAKAKVGLLSNIKANELVYARICREEMIKHGVRPSHIAHQVPLAVAACFIPLDSDFLAASIRSCAGMVERRALVGMPGGK